MNKRTSVVNISGDNPETLIQFAKNLGTEQIRRKIFDTIYGRGNKPKSLRQLMEKAGIPDERSKKQQVQNALDHLSKHHLIVKTENNGRVKDQSKYLYEKDETVRANKSKIVQFADNPQKADSVPTKRRQTVVQTSSIRQINERTLKARKHLNVLYLTANPEPTDTSYIQVDAEVRKVQEEIRGSKYRDSITLHFRPAAGLDSLIQGLNDLRPQVIHFSGHGNINEIAMDTGKIEDLETQVISFEILAKALNATDSPPEIVVLNSCNSSSAKSFLLPNAKVVIAMQNSISDLAAATFSKMFYAAIAGGQSVQKSFEQGKLGVEYTSITEANTPQIYVASDINASKLILT